MDYHPGEETASGYPRAERLSNREVACRRYEDVRLHGIGPPGGIVWVCDRNWTDGNIKVWSNGRAPPGCAFLEVRLRATNRKEVLCANGCLGRLRQERLEQLRGRLRKKCLNEMMHLESKAERDRQAKRKAAAEERAWEKDDKYANPSLVQIHSPSGQTLQLDQEGSFTFEAMILCCSFHCQGRELELEFIVTSPTGQETFSLSLGYVKAKRGDKETGANRKRPRLEESPAVVAPAFASFSPQQQGHFISSASLDRPPAMSYNPAAEAVTLHHVNSATVHPFQEAGLTDSSPSQDGYSEAQATTPPALAGSPSFDNSWIESHVSPPAHSFRQQLHHVAYKRQRLDKESSDVAAPAVASSSPQQGHIVPSASLDLPGPPAMGDDPTAESMLLHTAHPPCPESVHTGGSSEDQAITSGLFLTESDLEFLRSLGVPSGSDGPPFVTGQPVSEAEQPHPHDRCPVSWLLKDHHEGPPTDFSSCASPPQYTGSSPDLECSGEAAADFTNGSDSSQCYW